MREGKFETLAYVLSVGYELHPPLRGEKSSAVGQKVSQAMV